MIRAAVFVSTGAFLVAGCGGADLATLTLTVTDLEGRPIEGASVVISGRGEEVPEQTDATGIVRIRGLEAGVYQVRAWQDGYYENTLSVTVPTDAEPDPLALELFYVPPRGAWLWRPRSTLWRVLIVVRDAPFSAQLREYEWHCWGESWSERVDEVYLDEEQNALRWRGGYVEILGPEVLADAGLEYAADAGRLIPNLAVGPPGACTGGSAAWDTGG